MNADLISAIRDNVDVLTERSVTWDSRPTDDVPMAACLIAANEAIDAIDALTGDLHKLREAILSEKRVVSRQGDARVDRLLRDYHSNHSG